MRISRSHSDVGQSRTISMHDGYQPFRRQGSRESSGSEGKGPEHREFDSRIFRRNPDKQVTFQDEQQTSPPRMQHNRDGMQPYRRPNQRQDRRSWDNDIENQLPREIVNNPLLRNANGRQNQSDKNDRHWDQHDRRSYPQGRNDRNWGQGDSGQRNRNDHHWDQHDRRGNTRYDQDGKGNNFRGRGRNNSTSDDYDRNDNVFHDKRRTHRSFNEHDLRDNNIDRGNYQKRDYDRRDNYRDIREQYRKGDNPRDRQGNQQNGPNQRGGFNDENRPPTAERSFSREDRVEVSCLCQY